MADPAVLLKQEDETANGSFLLQQIFTATIVHRTLQRRGHAYPLKVLQRGTELGMTLTDESFLQGMIKGRGLPS